MNNKNFTKALLLFLCIFLTLSICSAMELGNNFWNIDWGNGTRAYFKDGVDFSTTTNPWKPEFIQDLTTANYKCLRFMDWCRANDIEHVNWSEHTSKTSPKQNPVAYEWMIDLCNRMGCDMWICLPAKSNADYHYKLAQLIKAELNHNLKVYIEWANETWNGMFIGYTVSIERGQALGLPGENQYYQSWAYHVYAAVRIFEQFERIFGVNNPRIVKVIAGQAGWNTHEGGSAEMARWHIQMLNDSQVNLNGITANAYALGPYMGGNSVDELYNNIFGNHSVPSTPPP